MEAFSLIQLGLFVCAVHVTSYLWDSILFFFNEMTVYTLYPSHTQKRSHSLQPVLTLTFLHSFSHITIFFPPLSGGGGRELLRHILRSFLITSCSKCFEKSFGSRREFYDKRVFTLSHSLWPLHFFLFLFFAVSRFWTQRDILLLKHFSHLRKSIHSENIYTFACQGLSVL